jgi:hypothetical protein
LRFLCFSFFSFFCFLFSFLSFFLSFFCGRQGLCQRAGLQEGTLRCSRPLCIPHAHTELPVRQHFQVALPVADVTELPRRSFVPGEPPVYNPAMRSAEEAVSCSLLLLLLALLLLRDKLSLSWLSVATAKVVCLVLKCESCAVTMHVHSAATFARGRWCIGIATTAHTQPGSNRCAPRRAELVSRSLRPTGRDARFTCRFASLRSALESFSFFRFLDPYSIHRTSTPPVDAECHAGQCDTTIGPGASWMKSERWKQMGLPREPQPVKHQAEPGTPAGRLRAR